MAIAMHNIYPEKYHLPEVFVPSIGTVGAKSIKQQVAGKTKSVLVLFESAMTDDKFIPKKIIGREGHVYPDMEQVGDDVPFSIGDTRAATSYFRGRHTRRYNRNHLHLRGDREDALVYPFNSIGVRSEWATKEKETLPIKELMLEKKMPKESMNKRYIPELDRLPIGLDPGYNEPSKPSVNIKNLNQNVIYFSKNPQQYDFRVVKSPCMRTVRVRWRGRLFERRSGQIFWPTIPRYWMPKTGHGPHNWGPVKDSTVANEEFEAEKIVQYENSLDDYYNKQPSEVPQEMPTIFDYLPESLKDEIEEQEWLQGPVEDGYEGYYYSLEQDDDEFQRELKLRVPSQLDPSKVITADPVHQNYYTELLTPKPTPRTMRRVNGVKTPSGMNRQMDQAWVSMPGMKMMWEMDLGYNEVRVADRVDSTFATKVRYGFDVLEEETK
jgi:hypothetical protein